MTLLCKVTVRVQKYIKYIKLVTPKRFVNKTELTSCNWSTDSWSRALTEKLTVTNLIRNFPNFRESQVSYTLPIVGHRNVLHALPFCFFKIHFSIILLSTPRPSKRSPSFRCPHPNYLCFLSPHRRAKCPPSRLSKFYQPNNIGDDYNSRNSSLCTFPPY